jgi:hypothetical protein
MGKSIGVILGTLALFGLAAVLMAYPIMLLWNSCLVPAIGGVAKISFWQAFGIKLLISFITPTSYKSDK